MGWDQIGGVPLTSYINNSYQLISTKLLVIFDILSKQAGRHGSGFGCGQIGGVPRHSFIDTSCQSIYDILV